MSEAEALVYCGILNRKGMHRSIKARAQKAKEAYEKGTLKKLFKVEKVERPKFDLWMEEATSTYQKISGHSVKMSITKEGDRISLIFKSEFRQEDPASDEDSADSQSLKYNQKFANSEFGYASQQMYKTMIHKMMEALDEMGDLPTSEEIYEPLIEIQVRNESRVFDFGD
mmetsp:Transcript_3308/g.5009  ORF Transcript_3308/g.5009 Transcript_3308/m.5009 type:complete len:170 (-) Transcript_3308:278-787(-)